MVKPLYMADPLGPNSTGPGESDDRIIQTDLRNEMSRSYLEYAMSVIVGRALPDSRAVSYTHLTLPTNREV